MVIFSKQRLTDGGGGGGGGLERERERVVWLNLNLDPCKNFRRQRFSPYKNLQISTLIFFGRFFPAFKRIVASL